MWHLKQKTLWTGRSGEAWSSIFQDPVGSWNPESWASGHEVIYLFMPRSSKAPFRKKQYSELLGAKVLNSSNPLSFVSSTKACCFHAKLNRVRRQAPGILFDIFNWFCPSFTLSCCQSSEWVSPRSCRMGSCICISEAWDTLAWVSQGPRKLLPAHDNDHNKLWCLYNPQVFSKKVTALQLSHHPWGKRKQRYYPKFIVPQAQRGSGACPEPPGKLK